MMQTQSTRPTDPEATAIAAWGRPAYDRMCAWIGVHAPAALGSLELIEIRALIDEPFAYPFFCPAVVDTLYQCTGPRGERIEEGIELPGELAGLALTLRALAVDELIDPDDKGEARSELLDAANEQADSCYPQYVAEAFKHVIDYGWSCADEERARARVLGVPAARD